MVQYMKQFKYALRFVKKQEDTARADVQHYLNIAVSAKSITEIVSKLECGKSVGPDR